MNGMIVNSSSDRRKFLDRELRSAIADLKEAVTPLRRDLIVQKYMMLCDEALSVMDSRKLTAEEFYIYLNLFDAVSEKFMGMIGSTIKRDGAPRSESTEP
jgi:hypothetical protein